MKRSILLAGICALLLQTSAQAGFYDDFDGYTRNQAVSYWLKLPDGNYTGDSYNPLGIYNEVAAPNLATYHWVTTDLFQDDAASTGWPNHSGDLWAEIGGSWGAPSQSSVELWSPVNEAVYWGQPVAFNVKFGIDPSTVAYPTMDSFGWTVRNVAGDKLFAVLFKASDAALSVVYDPGYYGVYTENAAGVNVFTGIEISLGSIYNLSLAIDLPNKSYSAAITPLGTLSEALNPALYPTQTFGASDLPDATNVGAVAATWNLADPQVVDGAPTNAGDNRMFFDNYSIVPEPSSVALVFGGLGLLTALQRRRARG
ncbi:MAG: PEP-CTERM sorting domain-containing protein [Verrucomicrobia bacterium]|nr:PEP-CTERM sorting domain-containing protein [Verrucomicrobiota bacterium]